MAARMGDEHCQINFVGIEVVIREKQIIVNKQQQQQNV